MNSVPLPADDRAPVQLTPQDRVLRRQLEEATARYFYESCDGVTQALLCSCVWSIAISADALTLVITCPDSPTSWRVLHNIVPLGTELGKFSLGGKIRVCPPTEEGTVFEIRVDELEIYRDSL